MARVYPQSVHVGEVYHTKDGDLCVIRYDSALQVLVEFTNTKYRRFVAAGDIRRGRAKDRMRPSVFGVGFLGEGKHLANSRRVKSQAYNTWHNMIQRCYSLAYQKKYPYWRDCVVCTKWHNFQNFAEWFYENHVEGYDLDKDCNKIGNKTYSPDYCEFIPTFINRSTQDSVNRKTI